MVAALSAVGLFQQVKEFEPFHRIGRSENIAGQLQKFL